MFPANAKARWAEWSTGTSDQENDADLQRELANSIHNYFDALAIALERAATLGAAAEDDDRLRAATAAAIRGRETARQLIASLGT